LLCRAERANIRSKKMENDDCQPKILIQLKTKDIRGLKEKLHKEQNGICPLLGLPFPPEDMALDHKHKLKSDPAGPNGDGLVRGAIHKFANAIEGKITNNWKRTGLGYTDADLPTYLRNLADYLENPPCEQIYIHPSESPRKLKIKKSCYNTLVKVINGKQKVPDYPKNGYLTKGLEKLFTKYSVDIEYYK